MSKALKKIVCVIIGVISHKEVIRAMWFKVLILKALNKFLEWIIKILKIFNTKNK